MSDERTDGFLAALRERGELRELNEVRLRGKTLVRGGREYLNLCSNDYLGLTDDTPVGGPGGRELQREFFEGLGDGFMMGTPSSRLMGGNVEAYEKLEGSIAALFGGDRRATVLSSGFATNSGVLPALTTGRDLILADKLCHASLIDGARLCEARFMRFRHNDAGHLETLLKRHRDGFQNVWIVTESIFSMDGDCAPLAEMTTLRERYGARILLDEAHSFGVCGPRGEGYARSLGLSEHVDVLISGLGKAVASTGGFVLTDAPTRELLVNRMRTLIYSTALPEINLLWSDFIISRLPSFGARRERLEALGRELAGVSGGRHIVPLTVGDNLFAVKAASRLRDDGFWAAVIRSPTVPRGTERVRVSLCASMTLPEVSRLRSAWEGILEELKMSIRRFT